MIVRYITTKTSNGVYSAADSQRGCQLIIWPNFAENCMKMKKLDREGEGGYASKFYYVDRQLLSRLNIAIIFPGQDFTAEHEQNTEANENS